MEGSRSKLTRGNIKETQTEKFSKKRVWSNLTCLKYATQNEGQSQTATFLTNARLHLIIIGPKQMKIYNQVSKRLQATFIKTMYRDQNDFEMPK